MILVQLTDFVGNYALARSNALDPKIQAYIDSLSTGETITLRKLLGKELADLLIPYIQLTKTIQTSGALVVGVSYTITDYVAGDDFTNIGAASNATGVTFTATGTTPADYSNGSTVSNHIDRFDALIDPFYIEIDCACGWWDSVGNRMRIANSHGLKNLLMVQIYYSYVSKEQIINSQSGAVAQATENGQVTSPQNAFRMGELRWNEEGMDTWSAVYWYCKFKYPQLYPEFKGIMEEPRYSSVF